MIAFIDNAERNRVESSRIVRVAREHERRCEYAGQPVADMLISLPPTSPRLRTPDNNAKRI